VRPSGDSFFNYGALLWGEVDQPSPVGGALTEGSGVVKLTTNPHQVPNQSVPRRKHSTSAIKTNLLVMY